jgi:hypothetical protein
MAVSWQGIDIGGGSWSNIGFILRSGNHYPDQPNVSISVSSSSIISEGDFLITGVITDWDPTTELRLFVVVDFDISGISEVGSGLNVGPFTGTVSLRGYGLAGGSHEFSFYVVNAFGFVSNEYLLTIDLLPPPISTIGMTPTLSQSPIASQSPAPYASPYPTSLPLVLTFPPYCNFDVFWRSDEGSYIASTYPSSTYWGFRTLLRVNGITQPAIRFASVTVGGITLNSKNISLSLYTILIIYRLDNTNSNDSICDVAIYADTHVGVNHSHYIDRLSDSLGVYWSGVTNVSESFRTLSLNVIAGNYPLTSNLTRYWYGFYELVSENYWNQVETDGILGTDVAMAVSWQGINIGGGSWSNIGFILRSGNHYPEKPVLMVKNRPLLIGSSLLVDLSVVDRFPTSVFKLFVVVDGDLSAIALVASEQSAGDVHLEVNGWWSRHSLLFYAVNGFGHVSDPVEIAPRATLNFTPYTNAYFRRKWLYKLGLGLVFPSFFLADM